MKARTYVGTKEDGNKEVFKSKLTEGRDLLDLGYKMVEGPFRTVRAAQEIATYPDLAIQMGYNRSAK